MDMSNLSKTQIKSIVDRFNNKLKELNKDVIITTGLIFTSDTDFYYIFNVYKNNKILDKIRANNVEQFNKAFKDLTCKYEVNIIYDYTDLTYSQLDYLYNNTNDKQTKIESIELYSAYLDSILSF